MGVETTYHHAEIKICGKCKGTGSVRIYAKEDILHMHDYIDSTCTQCEGSGLVVTSGKTVIHTHSYKPFKIK